MSFDDLAFMGHRTTAAVPYICLRCATKFDAIPPRQSASAASTTSGPAPPSQSQQPSVAGLSAESVECPNCAGRMTQRVAPTRAAPSGNPNIHSLGDLNNADAGAAGLPAALQALFANLALFGDQPQFINAAGGGGSTYADMVAAQQGVNVDDLMNQLLSNSDYNSPPTAEKFLKNLSPKPLKPTDFVQVYLEITGVKRDIFVSAPEFGPSLLTKHAEENKDPDSDHVVEHLASGVCVSDPIQGNGNVTNTGRFSDRIVLFQRGITPFADKVRLAQQHGAVAVIVAQNDEVWPYTMTDNATQGRGITIPSVMVSQKDGLAIQKVLEASGGDGIAVRIKTRAKKLACPVCREDFSLNNEVIKLPCQHCFCQDCILPWLKKRNTCPLCRYALPVDPGKYSAESEQTRANRAQLESTMFT